MLCFEANKQDCLYNFTCFLFFQLGPWLAVEIPDLIEKGLIEYKEKSASK